MNWIRENIKSIPSLSSYIQHIEVIELNVSNNPTLCVETCKSLIEGICKTILTNKGETYEKDITFSNLVQRSINSIINDDESFKSDIVDLGRRIAGVAHKISEIRNNTGFISHGMDVLNPKLTETISSFCFRITDTIGGFILSCYSNNRKVSQDKRIHYEDCYRFNEYFDGLNSFSTGIIVLSASLALYNQDYEAYKESFYDYLEQLENGEIE